MKLLIMGVGYTGMALLRYLQNQNHEVFVTTTDEKRVEFLKPYAKNVCLIDAQQQQDLYECMDASDAMIILIAPKNSQNYKETYLSTAENISKGLENRKRPLHLIYTSSTSVYDGNPSVWVTEDLPLNPPSENGKILLETEKRYLDSKAHTCILRLGGIYGSERTLEERARRLSGRQMEGTGEEATNHIHREDIVHAIVFCLENSLTGVYNLVNDKHPKRKALYGDLCRAMNLPLPIWNLATTSKNGYMVSNKKIKDAGFIFTHPTLN